MCTQTSVYCAEKLRGMTHTRTQSIAIQIFHRVETWGKQVNFLCGTALRIHYIFFFFCQLIARELLSDTNEARSLIVNRCRSENCLTCIYKYPHMFTLRYISVQVHDRSPMSRVFVINNKTHISYLLCLIKEEASILIFFAQIKACII